MLTNEHLVEEKSNSIGGVQRVYRVGNWGLSLINSPMAHSFPFAWEAAVTKYDEEGGFGLTYATPLTSDVEVFYTEQEAEDFLARAFAWFNDHPTKATTVRAVKAARTRRHNKTKKMLADLLAEKARRELGVDE
jgi:hypothetical protein